MRHLANLRVSHKLALAFGSLVALFVAVGGFILWSNLNQEASDRLNEDSYRFIGDGDNAMRSLVNMQTGMRGFLLTGEEGFLAPWNNGKAAFGPLMTQLKAQANEEEAALLKEMETQAKAFETVGEHLIDLRKNAGGDPLAMTLVFDAFAEGKDKAAMDAVRAAYDKLYAAKAAMLKERQAAANNARQLTRASIMIGVGLAAAMAALFGVLIARTLARPLHQATDMARRIAEGDLTGEVVQLDRRDEVGQLAAALGAMQQRLVQLVRQVQSSSESIQGASTEIAAGNQDLSARTEQAASNLQQTASSMEQLTGTVKQSADSARQANQLASSASSVAARGGQVVSQVVTTMDEINAASKKISDIIGVIDGIAFQTNILALNAAVEAARAGEQGRGFAVVAGEVRNLAQRSAQAAKEIKTLIGASVEKVESGSKLVQDAGTTMSEIVASVQRVADIIGEITAAAAEQSSGIGQVNTAVNQLDQMTQQNAALVEESAAAAESLKEQAHRLAGVVGAFKLAREAHSPA